ncbi:MAG: PAS domain S-box protein [Promethearchaeota archaeon]
MSVQKKSPQAGSKEKTTNRFERLVEASGALIIGVDRKGQITLFNRRCEEVSGYKREKVLGKGVIPLLIAKEERKEVRQRFKKLLNGNLPSSPLKVHWIDKRRGRHLIQWNNTFLTDIEGHVSEILGIGIDLTEQQQTEESLEIIQQEHLLVLETVSDVVLILDSDFRVVSVSNAVEPLLGYKPKELVGKSFPEIGVLTPDSLERAVENARRVLRGEKTPFSIYEFIRKDGRHKFGEIRSAPIVRNGKMVGIITIARDVTQRVLTEAALKESEKKYRALVEQSLEGIVIIQDNKIVFANSVITKLSGYSHDEVLNLSTEEMWNAIHPEDRQQVMERLQNRMSGKVVPKRYQVRVFRKDGTFYWAELSVDLIEFSGKPAIQATYIDITDRKKVEERYRSLVESVPVGLFRTTPDGRILDANPALAEMLGFDNKEALIQRKASEFYVDPRARKKWEELVRKEEVVRAFEAHFRSIDGELLWIELNARAIRDANGEVYCYEGTIEDITERKEAELKLSTAHQRAEFLVDLMAHDLNNINQGIMLSLELIASDEQLPKHLREGLQSLVSQVERSADLISNVKRFQSLESEPRRLSTRDLAPPFHAAVRAVERAFPNKQVFLSTNIEDQTYWVKGDGFLTELFFNILHNAVKMDRNPLVKIEVQASNVQANEFVKIEVQDQGPGVPDSEKKKIFNRFPKAMEKVRGSGIGLTLVQRILQRYGGQIKVKDRISGDHSQGANFVLLIPRGDR